MYLDLYSKDGHRYIRISESVRVEKNSTRVTRKKVIKNIGPVSRYDDGKPNFEQRLRDSFKACNPIIPELLPFIPKEIPKEIYHLSIHADTDECVGEPKLFASCIFDKILDELGIRSFVGTFKNYDKINYDVLGFLKLAIYGRILNPASKFATVNQNDDYYSPILTGDFYEYNIYDMLDFVSKHKSGIFNRIDLNMRRTFKRTSNKIYYDVTNFFFECDNADKYTDEDGEIVYTGLRQYGVSKENRKQPIVQMGLLMDEQGYPISIETFKGNTLDHQTLVGSFENSAKQITKSRYIFVSDKGIGRGGALTYAIENGNGYITSKSIRSTKKEDIDWILEDDFKEVSDNFKIKSKTYVKTFTLENGSKIKSSEKMVTYWSKKFYEKQYAEKRSFYDFVKKLIETPENFRITKFETGLISKYLKKYVINETTGEIIDSQHLKAILDIDKLESELKLLGYYSIVTSETEMSDEEIVETYHNLVAIEDEFRIMKMSLNSRPMYVRNEEHITAHLTICTIALLFIRIIQTRLKSKGMSMSAERIRKALNKWQVEKLADEYYRFNSIQNKDLSDILNAFEIEIPKKLYRIGDLKHIKQTIKFSD
jgi:transposase